jgi:hypothetical protein
MKRRIRKVANFFAFNLLFFALYLNFVHKDKSQVNVSHSSVQTPAFSETQVASSPANIEMSNTATEKLRTNNTAILKLSIN